MSLSAGTQDSYEEQTVVLSATSADSDESPLIAALSCDDGLLEDTNLTLPSVNEVLVVTCEASASAGDGTLLTDSIEITVSPYFNNSARDITEN